MLASQLAREMGIPQQQLHDVMKSDHWCKVALEFCMSFEVWEFRKRLEDFRKFQENWTPKPDESKETPTSAEDTTQKFTIHEIDKHVEIFGSSATKGSFLKYRDQLPKHIHAVLFDFPEGLSNQEKAAAMRGAMKRLSRGKMSGRCSNNQQSIYSAIFS